MMDKNNINKLLKDKGITVIGDVFEHAKASECYIKVLFTQEDGFKWETYVPFVNRRMGLNIENDVELAAYLQTIKPFFQKSAMKKWAKAERKKWEDSKADVTKEFFFRLLSFQAETEFPPNDNPARRFQDIKDAGYTLITIPNYIGRKAARQLLPLPLAAEMGYETFTPQFKARVIKLLRGINAYESKPTTKKGLIPDHKFSEVRWDPETKGENPMEMTDEEIVNKFQLLDNQRNQQKREVCRKCFQDGIRGVIYGIPFFYKGDKQWDPKIPQIGKEAEKGCIGCAWYDIERWRQELIDFINENKN